MTTASLHRSIWAIALPAMLTNIATALFGLADLWVIGRLGDASLQGGVEVGAKFMMGLLVVFNFLRMGTTALTAQAAGRGDADEQAEVLLRALALSLFVGLLLLALKPWAVAFGMDLLAARGEVAAAARPYIEIRYRGGLLWLVGIVVTGWLIGRRRVRAVLAIEVAANLLHVALDLLFVLGLRWGVEGVAIATLLSEAAKLAAGFLVAAREPSFARLGVLALDRATWNAKAGLLLAINRDLFLRTLLLMTVLLSLTRVGAQSGAAILAANGILLQLTTLQSLILDGFESAGQVLGGEAAGTRDRLRFNALLRTLIGLGCASAAVLAFAFAAGGTALARTFSTDPAVLAALDSYGWWLIVMPVAGVASYVLDGLFVGATWTRAMLATMAGAAIVYVAALYAFSPWENHGLWAALALFAVARAAGQLLLLPRLVRQTFGPMIPFQQPVLRSQP